MIKYFKIYNYSMKCRLYPNKAQVEYIDKCLRGMKAISNMILYDMCNNNMWVNEAKDKQTGDIIHWADYTKAFSGESLNNYRSQNTYINYLPGAAISSKKFGLAHDFKKSAETPNKVPIEKWGNQYIDKKTGEKITLGAKKYSKAHPPKSFSYPTTLSNMKVYENRNVIGILIGNQKYKPDGYAKIRGWNKKIRFDEEYKVDFIRWIQDNQKDKVQIRICKDNCNDYWIVFTFKSVYKPMNVPEERGLCEGIDVGERTLAVVSDGNKYENYFNHYGEKINKEKETLKFYNKKLARSEGWKNPKFKEKRKHDRSLYPSTSYLKYSMKYARLSRKVQRQRELYYNEVTAKLATSYEYLGIEGLNVKDMQYKKEKKNDSREQNK